jgi:hypothetical protein
MVYLHSKNVMHGDLKAANILLQVRRAGKGVDGSHRGKRGPLWGIWQMGPCLLRAEVDAGGETRMPTPSASPLTTHVLSPSLPSHTVLLFTRPTPPTYHLILSFLSLSHRPRPRGTHTPS